jgi:hypothetical protein
LYVLLKDIEEPLNTMGATQEMDWEEITDVESKPESEENDEMDWEEDSDNEMDWEYTP